MAKFKKKKGGTKTRTRTIVKTKTRRVFVAAKRAGNRARRAAGERMSAADVVLSVAGAGVGSIGGSLLLAKMPESIPDVAKNGVLAAGGGFLAYKGIKKRNRLFMGLGLGAAAAAVTNIISGFISGGTVSGLSNLPLAAPYNTLGACTVGAPYHTVGAPLGEMGCPGDQDEEM